MFAQAISSTAATTIMMIVSGCSKRVRSGDTPVAAGTRVKSTFRYRAR
jgi:hypothetical protein